MTIEYGLLDHQVLQREASGTTRARLGGSCATPGEVVATVRCGARLWQGIAKRPVGRARGGRFQASLPPLATGGPYTIELAIVDAAGREQERLRVNDILVGDLWLAGGQSNMEGYGHLYHPPKPVAQVRAFMMDDVWRVAADPIHVLAASVDPAHAILCGGRNPDPRHPRIGSGPAVTFAQTLHAASGVPQGIIACAHGGTSMTQWDPDLAPREGNRCLFGALLRRLHKNGGRVAGLIWYQGCNDANPADAPHYTRRMVRLVAALRRAARAPQLPVAMVQIARASNWCAPDMIRAWNDLQEQQRNLPRRIRRLAVVSAVDLPLDDGIHIAESGNARLGRRLAQAMQALRGGRGAPPPPIALKGMRLRKDDFGRTLIEVQFAPVVGRLSSGSCRPHGFHLTGDTVPFGAHFDTVLSGDHAVVRTSIPWAQVARWQLSYGHGTDPYCNIVDAADRSLPAFGPVPVGRPRALLPALDRAWVAPLLPLPADWADRPPPADPAAAGWTWRLFPAPFLSLRPEIERLPGEQRLLGFLVNIRCPEAMRLAFSLGYDGPMQAWLDGTPLVRDLKGTNPCLLGQRRPIRDLPAGRHQLAIMMTTNGGAAWGAMAQLERVGLTPRQLRAGDTILPVIENGVA